MKTVDMIENSRLAAQLAWSGVKMSDPATVGLWGPHLGISAEDHEYARSLLSKHLDGREVVTLNNGKQVSAATILAAQDVANYMENGTGWGHPSLATQNRADPWLAVATLMQYQNIIRQQAGGDVGARAEEGMQKILERFAGTYPIADPKQHIQQVIEQVNPMFEDGTRLSDHQRSSGPGRAPDPRVDSLSIRSLADRMTGQTQRQENQPERRRDGMEAFTGIGPGTPSS